MNKKILNVSLVIIVILIVIIFGSLFYVYSKRDVSDSVYEDVNQNLLASTNIVANEDEGKKEIKYELQTIMPFTGAFPYRDIVPFLFEDTNFSNEQILMLGFSKVTKDDWADSYTAENKPLSISANILDGYIKNIFGQNVQYEKGNFSNMKYSIDKDFESHTNSYEAVYVPETDTYTINHVEGDGIDENFIEFLEPSVSKIQGRLEVEIPYVFVVYADEQVSGTMEDGTPIGGFEYILYGKCDYPSKTFTEEIGRYSDIDPEVLAIQEFNQEEYIKNIAKKDLSRIPKLTLVYEPNEEQTEYVLKQVNK